MKITISVASQPQEIVIMYPNCFFGECTSILLSLHLLDSFRLVK